MSDFHSDNIALFCCLDNIKFGEVVQQPPQILSLPKKAELKSKVS